MPTEPHVNVESIKVFAELIALGGTMWAVVRVVFRPFVDASRFDSFKRKGTDVNKFLREELFKEDLLARAQVLVLAQEGMGLATKNAMAIASLTTEISRVFSQQAAQNILLNSIPHLAGSMEIMSSTLERLSDKMDAATDIARTNGELLAAHAAILAERRTANQQNDQRQHVRRQDDVDALDTREAMRRELRAELLQELGDQ